MSNIAIDGELEIETANGSFVLGIDGLFCIDQHGDVEAIWIDKHLANGPHDIELPRDHPLFAFLAPVLEAQYANQIAELLPENRSNDEHRLSIGQLGLKSHQRSHAR